MNTIQQLSTLYAFCALYSKCEYDPNSFFNSHDSGMNKPIFDLIIYHHRSLSGHRMTMLEEIFSQYQIWMQKLHVFVDHEPDMPIEPVPIEVVKPMLLLQSPSEVKISYEENFS